MNFPDYLIIGAQKAGTTWLQHALSFHPQVFAPAKKEIHFFDKANHFVMGPDWYAKWFDGKQPHQITGDATPNYLWIPESKEEAVEAGHMDGIAERVHAFNPDIRWIAILRDPVDRAVSAYYHHIRAGKIHPSQPIRSVWHKFGIRSMGCYAQQLDPWQRLFPESHGLVLSFEEDVIANPMATIHRVCRFLQISEFDPPSRFLEPQNSGSSHFLLRMHHKLPLLAKVLGRLDRSFGKHWKRFHIPIAQAEIYELRGYYRRENVPLV